ncbi:Holliday junction branch migration DNA helicase RuvB [Candidatus Berkelbacteria bacterium CG_4_9_14_3_um_filter_39_23]|uniref:Holliday junction branch migration complex subunit RuvB n=2 Tax=Candidatus Berkelbacteria TaxID=1618330 RepID=A0A2M7CHQ3_9BACT|nr:Holliday junction branch migration DNA helicase RuvB [Candidatus Berkelbacteria bacterium]OIP05640.1 MAG: Holliday junction DNA helicase RuvB [Candidatus Berkelbacteria bacterium CG2_30_39_44]PIR28213.1 MAG: Holliday junction branch migration DNA helicase RuvB [Candidatus Berkelbacteria bacterium CG11_big_fil_rev_8_21_14_0_20_40_23]PIV25163.1 MAG: Holliday junction branch migration DNA helicase RuvB [Candidatus Berkelbacteria bacterium CG03_land_8_20_14_0_80_40_36]PIZ28664.1 MAG: Holliday ju
MKEKVREIKLDETVRPQKLADYIGQNKVKKSLAVYIEAAKTRKDPLPHVLIHGGPGLGKTTLANIIAKEMNVPMRITSGPAIERTGDLASILTNLKSHEVLFIDEIHRLNRNIEEVLYPAMEDWALDIVVGKGPSAKTLRLELPPFTLVGATTKIGALSSPLRDRFGVLYHLDFYENADIENILTRSSRILNIPIHQDACAEIALRSRRTPRIANRLLARIRDFAQVKGKGTIDIGEVNRAFLVLEIDSYGLDGTDKKILQIIAQKFAGGPVGLSTIAAASHEEKETIEDVIEPYLIQTGLLERTPKGRRLTPFAYKYLGIAEQTLV